MPGEQPLKILLVEDDSGHARLIEKNLRRAHLTNEIVTVNDGKKACDYLFPDDDSAKRPRTCRLIILLDLNLPVIDGFQVLERVKTDKRTLLIPVIVLSSNDDEPDVKRCYELGCNVFVAKPVDYQSFSETIQNLGAFLPIINVPYMR